MGSTYLSLYYHLIFGAKDRQPFIHTRWRGELHGYLALWHPSGMRPSMTKPRVSPA
jgi:hypothetical protein